MKTSILNTHTHDTYTHTHMHIHTHMYTHIQYRQIHIYMYIIHMYAFELLNLTLTFVFHSLYLPFPFLCSLSHSALLSCLCSNFWVFGLCAQGLMQARLAKDHSEFLISLPPCAGIAHVIYYLTQDIRRQDSCMKTKSSTVWLYPHHPLYH